MTENFKKVLEELNEHKTEDKQKMLTQAIAERLNKSLQTYYHELNNTVTNLSSKNLTKVSKEMVKDE